METENVKEILNNLLHKKLSDLQQDKEKEKQNDGENSNKVQIKEEVLDDSKNFKQDVHYFEHSNGICEKLEKDEFHFDGVTLQEILNEKKKCLLRNPEIVALFQSKLKRKAV